MQIEELNLEMRLYNSVKRAGINTTEELLDRLYLQDAVAQIGARNIINIEKALKKAGITQYARGDYITEDDIIPKPLTWEQLHGMVGRLAALDISTESRTAYQVVWLYSFNSDDTRISFQHNGNGYGNCGDIGKLYALKEGKEMIVTENRTPPADAELAVTAQYTEAYNLNVKIHVSMQAIQQNLYDMCSALKRMRDGKLYKELGYQNFEDYCKEEAGISRQHAYRYIAILEKLPSDFVTSGRQIGEHKLYLLTALTDEQRQEITETVDLESTTVRELREQIAHLRDDNKQLAAERKEQGIRADRLAREMRKMNDDMNDLQAQIELLEERPIEVAVQDDGTYEALAEEIDALREENARLQERSSLPPDFHEMFAPYMYAVSYAVDRAISYAKEHGKEDEYYAQKLSEICEATAAKIRWMNT